MMNILICSFVMLTILLVTLDGVLLSRLSVTRSFKVLIIAIAVIAIMAGASAYSYGLSLLISLCTSLFVFSGILLFPIFLRMQKE